MLTTGGSTDGIGSRREALDVEPDRVHPRGKSRNIFYDAQTAGDIEYFHQAIARFGNRYDKLRMAFRRIRKKLRLFFVFHFAEIDGGFGYRSHDGVDVLFDESIG